MGTKHNKNSSRLPGSSAITLWDSPSYFLSGKPPGEYSSPYFSPVLLPGWNGSWRKKNFPFFPYNGFAQIALVNICIWIIHISVLENNSLCSCFHQILVNKKSHSLRCPSVQFYLFCTCYGNRIRSRHIIKSSPSTLPLPQQLNALQVISFPSANKCADSISPHSNPESLQPRWHSQRLALRFQKFSNLQFLLRATGVDEIGGFENIG